MKNHTIKETNGNITVLYFPSTIKLTDKQKDQYLTIVKSAHGYGVKKPQLIEFSLGLMNILHQNINEQDSTWLFDQVKEIHSNIT